MVFFKDDWFSCTIIHNTDTAERFNLEGTEPRRRHRLRRRVYSNPGPNYAWHIDGHDKLKPFGFSVHGAINGYSRKVLWLKVLHSNNSPSVIGGI